MADVQFNILDRSDSYLEKILILLNRKCLKEIKKIFVKSLTRRLSSRKALLHKVFVLLLIQIKTCSKENFHSKDI